MPTRQIKVGNILVGGGAPITVQSMTNTKTWDVSATVEQIKRLEVAGCDIVRIAVPDEQSAFAIAEIKKNTTIPLVADIHFDYKLALLSMENAADAIRINPGNIGDEEKIKQVVEMAKSKKIPIRIGVNGGSSSQYALGARFAAENAAKARLSGDCSSFPQSQKSTLREPCSRALALVNDAARHIRILEKLDFHDIAVSLKASNVADTIAANRLFASEFDYPLHLGVTEAGTPRFGLVKSAIGIGSLLADGIGDTIRVSLTADPVEEVYAGKLILQSLGLAPRKYEVISCPTCGRCNIDIIAIATEIENALFGCSGGRQIKIAIMGCVVNGPGEARDADIGIAGGDGFAALFKHGEVVGKIPADKIVETLLDEIGKMERG